MPSPSQPTAPLSAAELDACALKIASTGWAKSQSAGPIMLTYATGVEEHWLLGLSAAQHEAPLVLAGLGRRGFNWWSPGGKLPGTARALQLLQRVAPASATIFADGGDTLVANQWTQAAVEHVLAASDGQQQHLSSDSSSCAGDGVRDRNGRHVVLTGAECNSWPLCYNASYRAVDPSHRRCLKRHAACYPNSGTYAGRPAALLLFVKALQDTLQQMNRRGYSGRLEAEKGNDQALLHQLYLGLLRRRQSRESGSSPRRGKRAGEDCQRTMSRSEGSAVGNEPSSEPSSGSSLTLHIDASSALFLSLFPCAGSKHYKLRGRGPFEYCHERPFDPLPRLRSLGNGSKLLLEAEAEPAAVVRRGGLGGRTKDVSGGRRLAGNALGRSMRRDSFPFLLHANGKHYRMRERPFQPLLRRLLAPLEAEKQRMESTPVLLVDSVPLGTCGVSTLGSVLRGWKQRTLA